MRDIPRSFAALGAVLLACCAWDVSAQAKKPPSNPEPKKPAYVVYRCGNVYSDIGDCDVAKRVPTVPGRVLDADGASRCAVFSRRGYVPWYCAESAGPVQ